MRYLILFIFAALSYTSVWAGASRDLKYIQYMSCKYSTVTEKYCTDKDEPILKNGTVQLSVTDDSIMTFVFSDKYTYFFKIKSIRETENSDGEPVVISVGENRKGEVFVLAIGNTYFNLVKKNKWGMYFTQPLPDAKDLSKYNFGSIKYTAKSLAACLYNKKSDDYTDSCSYNNFKEVIPFELKSEMRSGKLYVKIDTLPEFRVTDVTETKNDEKKIVWVLFGRDDDNDNFMVAIGPTYFNYVSNGVKVSFSEELLPDELVEPQTYSGSAVAVTSDVLITNGHVVKGLSSLGLYIEGKRIPTDGFDIIGELSDDILDLAILRVNGAKLKACPLSTKEPELGTDILVYGYPQIQYQGTDLKVTKGIVSGKNGFKGDKSTFQIDAAIQHGNSGGPIVAKGKVIGLATSFLHDSQNVNFGIKSSKIYHLLKFYGVTPKSTTTDFSKCTYMLIGE